MDDSMSPTLKKYDLIFINKILKFRKVKGKIVLLKNPYTGKLRYATVVGYEHDWIRYQPNNLFYKVPHGYVWVEQDNKKTDLKEIKDRTEQRYPIYLVSK